MTTAQRVHESTSLTVGSAHTTWPTVSSSQERHGEAAAKHSLSITSRKLVTHGLSAHFANIVINTVFYPCILETIKKKPVECHTAASYSKSTDIGKEYY